MSFNKTRRQFLIGSAATAAALFAFRTAHADAEDPMLTITGALSYRQRIALPANAVAHVAVRDASGNLIAETSVELAGAQVPVPFTLELARAHLDPAGTFTLKGVISIGPEVRWETDETPINPKATRIDTGTLWMTQQQQDAVETGETLKQLQSGQWRISEIAGKPVEGDSAVTISFDAEGSFSGRACNGFRGEYRINGRSIAFGRAMSTMMACAEPLMSQEVALFGALTQIAAFNISQDGVMTLSGRGGANLVVARK